MPVDADKPNISRIYDYVLGGHHNFEIDRMAAEQIMKAFPSYPRWARMNRWFLQMVGTEWSQSNYTCVLDLGSGMPTQGNMHEVVGSARVLYSDRDPVTVAYAQEVLADTPQVKYILGDARDPQPILAAADAFFEGERRVAIGCIGLAYFLDDTNLAALMQALYDWAAPGSVMAFSQVYGEVRTEANREATEAFKRSGAEIFPRNEQGIRQIVAPWQVRDLKPLATWLNVEELLQESDREGADSEMYGAILERP